MGIEILFEDAEMVVRAQAGRPGQPMLLSFGHLERRPEEPAFWAATLAAAMGWPAIGFVARRPNWFPAASVRAAAGLVRKRIAAARPENGIAIGYGYSMGGYAVLRHGRLLGLTHALAVSPQASIAPGEVPWEARFRPYYDPVLHDGMLVRPGDAPEVSWVLADAEHPEDAAHARLLEAVGARTIHTPRMNHNPIQLLSDRIVTEATLSAVLAEDVTSLRRLLRGQRHGSAFWHAGMGATLLAHGRDAAGLALLRRASEMGLKPIHLAEALAEALRRQPGRTGAVLGGVAALGSLTPRAWTDFCNQMASADHRAEALAIAEAGTAALGPHAVLLVQLGHLLLAAGRVEEARSALETAVAQEPGEGWAWVGLSLAHLRAGDAAGAEAAGREAARLRPGDAHAWLRWAAALAELGRFEEAEAACTTALPLGGGEEARIGILRARLETGRRAEAAEALREGMAAHPGSTALPRLARAHEPLLGARLWLSRLLGRSA
ncbi:MAG TPA: tetratricopeptide repeat protein [Roseomonas sp.]|jgi:Flp pilus assembly protein TadD